MTTPGRPRTFDPDAALECAMQAFWAHGYTSTSLADLIEATGLQKGSLYKAFGDKHTLFLRSLDRYLDAIIDQIRRDVEAAPSPQAAVSSWLQGSVSRSLCWQNRNRGCLAVNTVVELARHDEHARAKLLAHVDQVRGLIQPMIEQGQREGVFRADESPQELMDLLLVLALGMAAESKTAPPAGRGQRVMELTMRLLEP